MSPFGLSLTLTLREKLLVAAGNTPVSPRSAESISGPVIRGLLAGLCRGEQRTLDDLVLSGTLEAAPAFPLIAHHAVAGVAAPTPRTLMAVRGQRPAPVVDGRDGNQGQPTQRLPHLTIRHADTWHPVHVETSAELRLTRSRRGNDQEGFGPFVMVPIDPWQRFRAHLVLRADRSESERLREVLLACIERAAVIELGGATAAYGGDLLLEVGALSATTSTPVPTPRAGTELDVVLRAPAVVVEDSTGDSDPAALGDRVQDMLAEVLGDGGATVGSVSVGRHLLGGAHAGYGRSRPEHWAAAAGSVVRVSFARDVTAQEWQQLLTTRLGERTVDGLGIWAPELPVRAEDVLGAAVGCRVPVLPGQLRLGDGSITSSTPVSDPDDAVQALQHRLFTAATEEWINQVGPRLATDIDAASTLPSAQLLSRIRDALGDPQRLSALAVSLQQASPLRDRLAGMRPTGAVPALNDWLISLGEGTAAVATEVRPSWLEHLIRVELQPGAAARWQQATPGVDRRLALAVITALRTRVVRQ